jgi:hypothetical protein
MQLPVLALVLFVGNATMVIAKLIQFVNVQINANKKRATNFTL